MERTTEDKIKKTQEKGTRLSKPNRDATISHVPCDASGIARKVQLAELRCCTARRAYPPYNALLPRTGRGELERGEERGERSHGSWENLESVVPEGKKNRDAFERIDET